MENENLAGINGTATVSDGGTDSTMTTTGGEPEQKTQQVKSKPEQTFTKDQVNEMMKRRVERSHRAFFTRYGVKDLAGLDNLFGSAVNYDKTKSERDELSQKYSDLETQHKDLNKRYAYKVGNIDEKKIADIETYFKGKGIDIDETTLMNELKTHPDWVNKVNTIQQLGAEVAMQDENDARAEAYRIFGVSRR